MVGRITKRSVGKDEFLGIVQALSVLMDLALAIEVYMKKIFILSLFVCIAGHGFALNIKSASMSSVSIHSLTPRLMFMGDSITEGTGNTPWGYRQYFQQRILPYKFSYVGSYTDPNSDATYDVDHSGVSGNQIESLDARIDSELDTYFVGSIKGDSITILCGTNDIGSASDPFTAKMTTLTGIINKIVAHDPEISIYIMTIPDRNGATSASLAWNSRVTSLVSGFGKENMYLVDTRTALDNTSNCPINFFTSCSDDGLHPNATGHSVIASTLVSAIKQHQ